MWLERPPVNAIDLGLIREADEALEALEADDEIGAVVITGAGSSFSAGLDLKTVPSYDIAEQREVIEKANRVITNIYGFPKPTIAAVNGHAVAGGFILAISCDYRIGAEGPFSLGVTEVRAGIPFPIATIEVLKAELDHAGARRLILTGRNRSPEEALAIGCLDEIQPTERLMARARELAAQQAELPRLAFKRIKRQLRGDTIERIRAVMESGDPLLNLWISDESKSGAAGLLDSRD